MIDRLDCVFLILRAKTNIETKQSSAVRLVVLDCYITVNVSAGTHKMEAFCQMNKEHFMIKMAT